MQSSSVVAGTAGFGDPGTAFDMSGISTSAPPRLSSAVITHRLLFRRAGLYLGPIQLPISRVTAHCVGTRARLGAFFIAPVRIAARGLFRRSKAPGSTSSERYAM